jgi:ferritin-like metal-binding protein YciE
MNPAQKKIVQYLNEAHATEHALVRELQSQIAIAPQGSYRSALQTHLTETRDHATRVADRLKALGQGGNPLAVVVGLAETVVGQAVAVGKAPLAVLRGSGGEEKVLKNAKDACAAESLEIATYAAIERMARVVGDDETATLAASIRADEEKMLERVLREIPRLTDAVVRAEVKGSHNFAPTTTGDAPSARDAGRQTKAGARKTAAATKNTPSRARKTTRGAQSKTRIDAAGATDDLVMPASLRSESPSASDPEPSQRGPFPTIADESAASQSGDKPTATGNADREPATTPATGPDDELRTAAESGDVRAAYQLGTLLRERGDLEAAEEALRSATADPEAAHALGRLLWRERSDPHAAVEWLDRAAQADHPAAERDLGIVLREQGDIQGAHYWLSRAAERDGEAREALAGLVENR